MLLQLLSSSPHLMILGSFGHLFTVRFHFYRVELPVSFMNHYVKAIFVILLLLGNRVGLTVPLTFVPIELLSVLKTINGYSCIN